MLLTSSGAARAAVQVREQRIDDVTGAYETRLAYPQVGIASADADIEQWACCSWTSSANHDVLAVMFTYWTYIRGAHPNAVDVTFNYLMPDGCARVSDVMRPDPRAPLPSFDCAEASTAVAHAICSNGRRAQLDRRTAEAYAMRLRLEAIVATGWCSCWTSLAGSRVHVGGRNATDVATLIERARHRVASALSR